MFIKEKVFSMEKVKQTLDSINEINVTDSDIYEKDFADATIYIWCSHLTYDELIYLQEHSDLILSDYKKIALNVMIDEWNNIINQLNIALSNETIGDYLSTLQSSLVLNMKKFFGFNIDGVTFTEEGKKLYDALEKQIIIIDKQKEARQKEKDLLSQKKGYSSFRHELLVGMLNRNPERAEQIQKSINEEISNRENQNNTSKHR